MSYWAFVVDGEPVPQPRPRVSTVGGFARAYVPAKHPVHGYRKRIEYAAINAGIRAYKGGPIQAKLQCAFGRPASHLTKAGAVKPKYAEAIPRADVDNLAKAVLDGLGDLIGDDTKVQSMTVEKYYANTSRTGYTIVVLAELGSMAEINTEAA
jgi:Holliday junction resolvase RusA-like endonuclease